MSTFLNITGIFAVNLLQQIKNLFIIIFTLSIGWSLSTGDIAFTAFNADGDDDFAIVALADIPANTTIYFADKAPNSDGSGFLTAYEGILKWATGGSTISAGEIIVFTDVDLESNTNFGTSTGTLTDASFDAGFNLSGEGDAIYAVEGSDDGSSLTISAWLAGIQNESGNEGSNFSQTGLTAGTTFIDFYSSGSPDGGYYSGDRQGQSSFSGYLTHLGDATKWTTETSTGENILPISTSAFTLGVTISGDSGFRMMSSPVAGQIYSDLLSELWTQGMTSADVTSGDANVWTYDGSSWSALSDITGSGSGASLTAGQGFLVYVFADTDNDGTDDLPVTLSVSGTENNASATVPSSGSIADAAYELAGNPYASTIDWDLVTQTAVTTSCYVWDSQAGTPAYISWNGSAGSLTDGLIAPFQGFFVQGDGGSGSITIETADKSGSGTFYKEMNDSTGSVTFTITSGDYSDNTFVSFMTNGEEGIDNSDAYKLLPMTPTERIVGVSYAESNGLDINNLPYISENSINFPLDIMYLTVDGDYNFVTNENEVTMNWDLSNLPETIIGLTLTNNTTGESTDLLQTEEVSFTTVQKGSFPAYGSGGVNVYPEVGESQFTLSVIYSALSSEGEPTFPSKFALHKAYPNPFNPITTISFDVPANTKYATILRIFNIRGQLVESLLNEQMVPGTHSLHWKPKNISSGLYLIQLKSGDRSFNQKITLIK